MLLLVAAPAAPFLPPVIQADPDLLAALEEALAAAHVATSAFGAWPIGAWKVRIHQDAASFDLSTAAPAGRSGQWVGDTLHLRPWDQLRRRDLGAILRHELTHRRLAAGKLRRWDEEARCLWAEGHPRPPSTWPALPAPPLQDRLDRALAAGTTREQAWAYRWLRAWLRREPLPRLPQARPAVHEAWAKEAPVLGDRVTVVWPPERLRGPLTVNGQRLSHQTGKTWRFRGPVRFPEAFPVKTLRGVVTVAADARGWRLSWTVSRLGWIAAATEGELGAEAPFETRRALAAVLGRWLEGHPRQHPGGVLCPLTHCAVVRGSPTVDTLRASSLAPPLDVDPSWAFFTGSSGGHPLSPLEVWGEGPAAAGTSPEVPGDRWQTWERRLSPDQIAALKRDVKPGLKPGQRGLNLGEAGPYAMEELRLAAGRRFGWTVWPSNACEGASLADGSLRLTGFGWGHNVGLCLATARFRAESGATAEQILAEAFPVSWRMP